ncbi:NAD-dependent protein deacetylase [Herbaspirillum sp. RV1423]|uniref:NAD-dependent protein deacetylase n=1 Tax=Herbaspirillum sp. RV1423 TaxID=1443993 RepID=UPI0004B7B003|nr:NAD-dependent protein deacetylase [Herbaspirillum sp. RV1423]
MENDVIHINRLDADASAVSAFVAPHRNVLVLTGAGISTASGIPDYRDANGVRRGKAPMEGPAFRASETMRRRYWARSMIGWPKLAQTAPNAGHRALAALEAAGRIAALLTQNVDGLHQQAGSRAVIELHGNIHRVVCLACGTMQTRRAVQTLLERANPGLVGNDAAALPDGDAELATDALAGFQVPPCPACGGMLQPDVVFFGDGVPRDRSEAAERAVAAADAVLVVGSSLVVFSGYRFCRMAAEAGKPIAAINRGVTRADHLLVLKCETPAESLLPLLADRLHSD